MKFTVISAFALLSAGVHAAAVPVEPRQIDGCPATAPWPMGNPGTFWYPICCPYVLSDPGCCNRHPENPIMSIQGGDAPYPACPSP